MQVFKGRYQSLVVVAMITVFVIKFDTVKKSKITVIVQEFCFYPVRPVCAGIPELLERLFVKVAHRPKVTAHACVIKGRNEAEIPADGAAFF